MSSYSQQSNQVARFPLGKYSHAITSIDHNGPVNWNHLHGDGDLSVVFAKSPFQLPPDQQNMCLRVIHGQQSLEELDLNLLAQEASQQAMSRQVRNIKPLVAVIVKLPCLAIRYPSRPDQVRRFQVKFSSDRDYYNALAILSDINCPFTEPATGHTSRSSSLRPLSSSSRAMTPISSTFASSGDWTYNSPAAIGFNRQSDGLQRSQPTVGSLSETRPSISATSMSSISSHIAGFLNENKYPAVNHPGENDFSPRPMTQHLGYTRSESELRSRDSIQSIDRPTTAPAFHDPQALNRALPPKRELPFSRPGPRNSYTAERRHPAILPRADSTETNSKLQEGIPDAFSSRPLLHSSDGRQSIDQAKSSGHPELGDERLTHVYDQDQNQLSATPKPATAQSGRLLRSASKAVDSARSHVDSPKSQKSVSRAPVPHSNFPESTYHHSEPYQQSTAVGTENTIPVSLPQQITLHSADLASYLQKPDSERSALVDSWICQQLEDDGFLTLCQDVERVWKRIAFGS